MDKNSTIVALAGIIGGTVLIMAILQTVVQLWTKRHRPEVAQGGLGQIDERLSRMEQAIDAMAVEVERISEGQRFTTKLLSDRGERLPVEARQR